MIAYASEHFDSVADFEGSRSAGSCDLSGNGAGGVFFAGSSRADTADRAGRRRSCIGDCCVGRYGA